MKLFLESSDAIVDALTSLCVEENISEYNVLTLAKLVCKAYRPKGLQIESIPELRWYMFCKYMAESDKLPPTLGALRQHIARAHLQVASWCRAYLLLSVTRVKQHRAWTVVGWVTDTGRWS